MPADFPVIEFAEVVAGRAAGRANDAEVTIFDSVGFALEDFSALRYVHRLHREELGRRTTIDLVPELANPKDLFALLAQRPALAPVAAPAAAADAHRGGPRHEPPSAHRRADRRAHRRRRQRARRLDGPRGAARRGTHAPPRGIRPARGGPRQPRRPRQPGPSARGRVIATSPRSSSGTASCTTPCSTSCAPGICPCCSVATTRSASARSAPLRATAATPVARLRVLWLDAHADFNTHALSPSGNLHGMPLACLCGFGPPELLDDRRTHARHHARRAAAGRHPQRRSRASGASCTSSASRCSTCATWTRRACAPRWRPRSPASTPTRTCT